MFAHDDNFRFKIILQATDAECSEDGAEAVSRSLVHDLCPDGPCCSGVDCCVVELDHHHQGQLPFITSDNFPDPSKNALTVYFALNVTVCCSHHDNPQLPQRLRF